VPQRIASADPFVLADPQDLLPSGLLARVPLPSDLIDAIAAILEREAQETELDSRAQLLWCARAVLEAWMGGDLSTEEAIHALASTEPTTGIMLRQVR
jgi:hypothetical protein